MAVELGLVWRVVAGRVVPVARQHRQRQTGPEQWYQPNQPQLGTSLRGAVEATAPDPNAHEQLQEQHPRQNPNRELIESRHVPQTVS